MSVLNSTGLCSEEYHMTLAFKKLINSDLSPEKFSYFFYPSHHGTHFKSRWILGGSNREFNYQNRFIQDTQNALLCH